MPAATWIAPSGTRFLRRRLALRGRPRLRPLADRHRPCRPADPGARRCRFRRRPSRRDHCPSHRRALWHARSHRRRHRHRGGADRLGDAERRRQPHRRPRHRLRRRHDHLHRRGRLMPLHRRPASWRAELPGDRCLRLSRRADCAQYTDLALLPNYTSTVPGPVYSASQLAFVSTVTLALYAVFLYIQTVRHRDYFVEKAPMMAAICRPTAMSR